MAFSVNFRSALLWAMPAWIGLTGCAVKNGSTLQNAYQPNSNTDPKWFEEQFFKTSGTPFERTLDKLPLTGEVSEAWSDTFLPNRWGGAAVRWYGDKNLGDMDEPKSRPDMWTNKQHSLAELKGLPKEMLKKLSPAEKYDILLSRYDYPLTTSEKVRNQPNDANWEGVCNGWSTAAIKFSEPRPITIVNKDGIAIPFGSSDIKSLLMLHQYLNTELPHYAILGNKCESMDLAAAVSLKKPTAMSGDSLDNCSDANAGAFHLVVTNMMGRLHKGLVFDVDRDQEIWNQPVYKFQSRIVSRTPTSARVSTDVWYAEEVMPAWEALIPAKKNNIVKATYNYNLELDANGAITGGSWLDGSNRDHKNEPVYHPDFVWYGDGEDQNYILRAWSSVSGRSYTLPAPVEMGGIVELWKASVGKAPSFRGYASGAVEKS